MTHTHTDRHIVSSPLFCAQVSAHTQKKRIIPARVYDHHLFSAFVPRVWVFLRYIERRVAKSSDELLQPKRDNNVRNFANTCWTLGSILSFFFTLQISIVPLQVEHNREINSKKKKKTLNLRAWINLNGNYMYIVCRLCRFHISTELKMQ